MVYREELIIMSKILVIGLGSAGRNVCRILKDDGLPRHR